MPLGSQTPPTEARWHSLFRIAKSEGLTDNAAYVYATLAWWGEHYNIPAGEIVSGKRSALKQRYLRWRWDRGDRSGLAARPAIESKHTEGRAFDLARGRHLEVYGAWAPLLGARWGGTFTEADPVHFDV